MFSKIKTVTTVYCLMGTGSKTYPLLFRKKANFAIIACQSNALAYVYV